MKKITLMQTLGLLLLTFGLVSPASASDYPSISELYGRYKVNGESTISGITSVPAETDYSVAVLPGDEENELVILGLFGFSGASTFVYDQENGTLSSRTVVDPDSGSDEPIYPGEYLCGLPSGTYMAVQQTPINLSLNNDGNGLVLTTTDYVSVMVMDMEAEQEEEMMGTAVYANGFTLTKESWNKDISEVTGTYDFTAKRVEFTLIEEAYEDFQLTLKAKEDAENTIILEGLFDVDGASVEATYLPESGLIVCPKSASLSNGMYFGISPTNEEEMGLMNFNAQPVFFVGDGQLTTPSYIVLDNGFDEDMFMPIMFSILGGNAKKTEDGNGIHNLTAGAMTITATSNALRVETPEATDIRIYNVQGATVATAQAAVASFNGLPAGIYIVKAGENSTKVVVK